uniref:Uncharacterized protein n=1 Tax=viral metagenome TaxID=1070528 RepID=A0A6C0M0X2_9ZZZZ
MFNIQDKTNILIYIAIGIAIYYLFFRNTESFTSPIVANQCALLKNTNQEIKNQMNTKCGNFDEPSSRGNINQRSECYNFAGQEIVSELDSNSWCELDDNDKAIIEAATQNMTVSETPETMGFERGSFANY